METKPKIQIDDDIREMTDDEFAAWQTTESHLPQPLEEEP